MGPKRNFLAYNPICWVKPNGNLKPLNQGYKAWFLFSCMPCCSKQRKCD